MLLSLNALAMETPVGTLGNAKKVFSALVDSGAEVKSSLIGSDSMELIRAGDLVCAFESAPDLDARCTFYTLNPNGNLVKGVSSSEASWAIGFALIGAGASKTHLSETLSEVRVKSLTCTLHKNKTESDCRFLQ